DEARGVPFPNYALKCIVLKLCTAVRLAKKAVRNAYKACALHGELFLSDPKVLWGSEEERLDTLQRFSNEAAAAMVFAGAHSRDIAAGGEDALIDLLDGMRVKAAVPTLDRREQQLLELRYGGDEEESSDDPTGGGAGGELPEEKDERQLK